MYEDMSIEDGIARFESTEGAVLLDVRSSFEYAQGHIPGAQNIELTQLAQVESIANHDTPLFVYCTIGFRAYQAAAYLKQSGFTNVTNIGGIEDWEGEIE